ncbi:alpha/beta fold hydrolase [Arthrobacter psychrochitiniphilus]|uniref:Alpha/beta hydrolase n=1 Tax=Arthrobacter psychrochitiniphilus TaxID=291045 RepID=A0A2V3DVI3_9MICC|nr:alpha/beta hydrolase [Arthrobacter psychrochitiniphilus]NYG16761.1 pimeloyl-ACP methyl ester carboxylesterase [Arthrobacter psychrochitiniphilus]PXA69143.1 alpha/beta hydrolase [Arthrobacter psychrochitiniphilus]
MPLFEGIRASTVQTDRLLANVLTRTGAGAGGPAVVFVHGNVSSSLFWQPIMLALPDDVDAYAIDLRGFGGSEGAPVDASRGVRDFSDDVYSVVRELGLGPVHLVGWSMGGGVVMQYALDYPVASITLQAPVSPYGFGGTRLDGTRLTTDDAGTGGGGANPGFVAALEAGDTSRENPLGPWSVYKGSYVAAGFVSEHEDTWVESMLSTATGPENYPGDSVPSENWPGFAAGARGVLNTMSPGNFNVSAIAELAIKPPVLWVRGDADAIVSDGSAFDLNFLGQAGVIPGWPGQEKAPAQQMLAQTRAVLESYAAKGGRYSEEVFAGSGHSPALEQPERFVELLVAHVRGA